MFGNNHNECKSNGDINKRLSRKIRVQYLEEIRSYLKDTLDNLKENNNWKIQLTITINVMSSNNNDEECLMHSKMVIAIEII